MLKSNRLPNAISKELLESKGALNYELWHLLCILRKRMGRRFHPIHWKSKETWI